MTRARVIHVCLIVTESIAGHGKANDPVHRVTELWTEDGHLVASRDQWNLQAEVGDGFDRLMRMAPGDALA